MKDIFEICWSYIIANRKAIFFYVMLCVLLSLLSLATPYITGSFIDLLVDGSQLSGILKYCCLYIILTLISLIVGYINNRIFVKLQTTMGYELNKDLILKLQKIGLTYYNNKDIAALNQRINNDSNTLVSFCISFFQNTITNVLIIMMAVAIITSFDIIIAGTLIVLIPCYFFAYKKFRHILFKTGYELKRSQAEYFGKLYEQLAYIRQVKIFSLFSQFVNRLNNVFKSTMDNAYKYQNATYAFSALDTVILSIAQIVLFIYGGFKVISGQISIGNFTIISSYFGMMIASVRYFFSLGKNIQDTKVSAERLKEILNTKSETVGMLLLQRINKIQIENVTLISRNKKILSKFSATFEKGKIYVINGPNGSGKSTLFNLILGLYSDEFEGDVLYNQNSIKNIDMYELRKNSIGVVEQEPTLFEDTIRYNVFLDTYIPFQELISELIDVLNFKEFLSALPNGFDTKVSEKNLTISGGEKQKIALLRALIKNPEVLFLDEPTSALDSISTNQLGNYLKSIKQDKIIIVITHDEFLSEIADEIVYIKNGRCIY